MTAERPFGTSAAILAVGVVASGVLAWSTRSLYEQSETNQLRLRVRDAGALLTSALPSIETPLVAAVTTAATASATRGDAAARFAAVADEYAGAGRPFASMSLWRQEHGTFALVRAVGAPPAVSPSEARSTFDRAEHAHLLGVSYVHGSAGSALGFAVSSGQRHAFFAYALLPYGASTPTRRGSAFSDLNDALYLDLPSGKVVLLSTSVSHLPLRGARSSVRVAFGDAHLDLVMSPKGSLVGAFFEAFPWIVGGIWILLSFAAAIVTERLLYQRRFAEDVAGRLADVATENQRLFREQRSLAVTLQHALLPERLPDVDGLELGARYIAGGQDVDIGGDWYDILVLDDTRLLVVVGDVSGRGVQAATVMASLRFAAQAYARQGDLPPVILSKLSKLASVADGGHFATAICMVVDVARHELTIANAGHPPPLIVGAGGCAYVDTVVGVPIGVLPDPTYGSVSVPVGPGATVLAYTDGLVERRRELLDIGLERLRARVAGDSGTLDQLLTSIAEELGAGAPEDDTAIVALRWRS